MRRFSRWKRTYQAGIHWAGVGNTYRHNDIADGPHNAMLGGGNEADAGSTVAGVDCVFEGNAIDRCSFEAADTGAFYVCGQMGSAFVNRNNTVVNNRFSRIRNTVGTGVQAASVQAIYLDGARCNAAARRPHAPFPLSPPRCFDAGSTDSCHPHSRTAAPPPNPRHPQIK